MIDNFLGLCHIMRHAVMILFFFIKIRSSLQYFMTQGGVVPIIQFFLLGRGDNALRGENMFKC